jgi:hypothetical protein
MKRGVLNRIKPIHPELIPPQDAEVIGTTEHGKILYRQIRRMNRPVPDIDPDTGRQRWRKNQNTGEPLYPLFKRKIVMETRDFFLESQGNGNVGIVEYQQPTPEDLAQRARAQRIADMKDRLAERLVDAGLTADDLIERLGGTVVGEEIADAEPEEVEAEVLETSAEAETDDFPRDLGEDLWQLSNGQTYEGTEEGALDAQIRIMEAHEDAEVLSEGF